MRVLVITPTAARPVEAATGPAASWSDAAWAARWKGHGIRVPQSRMERERARSQPEPEGEWRVYT